MKDSNEITVKVLCSKEELSALLEGYGFDIKKSFVLDDTYFIPEGIDYHIENTRDVLSRAIILRKVTSIDMSDSEKKMVFKKKKYNEEGEILEQKAYEMHIDSTLEALTFLKGLGYTQCMRIFEEDIIFSNGIMEIAIKAIRDGDLLIEVETNSSLKTIEEIKKALNEYTLPLDESNYFVKKAEIELNKLK